MRQVRSWRGLFRSICRAHGELPSASERVAVREEIRRSATANLLDERIDQYQSIGWRGCSPSVRSLRQDVRIALISMRHVGEWPQMACGISIGVEAAVRTAVRKPLTGKPNDGISEDESLHRVCQRGS